MNCKIKCIRNTGGSYAELGKIYEVIDGKVMRNKGVPFSDNRVYKDIDAINSDFVAKFEIVQELPQPHKDLLKSGDKVVYRDGDERFVLLETKSLYTSNGEFANELKNLTIHLLGVFNARLDDIMEIWRGDELIAKRTELPKRTDLFNEAAKPLMEWLEKNCNPHHVAIVDSMGAQLMSGEIGVPSQLAIKYREENNDLVK